MNLWLGQLMGKHNRCDGGGADYVWTGTCVCAYVYTPKVNQPQIYFLKWISTLIFETCFLLLGTQPFGMLAGQQTPGICLSLCLSSTRIKSVCHSSRLTLFLTWVSGMEAMSFFPLHHLPSQGCIIFYRALWLQMLTDTLDVQSSLLRLVNACLDHSNQSC